MAKAKKQKLVEVVRSFSMKKNLGNYETCDFFASQKVECEESEAEKISELAYEFCKKEVVKSINKYLAEREKRNALPDAFVPPDTKIIETIQ